MIEALAAGGMVLVAGNGGSAAEAQHFTAELVGRFKLERRPLPALCLNADTAVITALGNDYGYQEVFARQVEAFAGPDDVLVLFSTSGESPNVVEAALAARRHALDVIAVTGSNPCRLSDLATHVVATGGVEPCRIQELHMVVTHVLCEVIEREFAGREGQSLSLYGRRSAAR